MSGQPQQPRLKLGSLLMWEGHQVLVVQICRGYVVVKFTSGRQERVTFYAIENALEPSTP